MTPSSVPVQPPATPGLRPPVVWATVGAAGVTVLSWLLREFAGVDMPLEIQGAVTTLAVAILGWFAPNR